jgi:hypothetical protein
MSVWMDGIVDEQGWREETRKLLIVCPEPNEEWMHQKHDDRRDMRQLLRAPEDDRKPFYARLRQAVRAFHGLPSSSAPDGRQEHFALVRRIAFINLKNIGGGPRADQREIDACAQRRRTELVSQIGSIAPTHIFLAGSKAQRAFRAHIGQHIGIEAADVPHPSCRLGYGEYYRRVNAAVRCLTTRLS